MKRAGVYKIRTATKREPVLYVSELAQEKMDYLVQAMKSNEISWLGVVHRIDEFDFYMEDIEVFSQEVTGVVTIFDNAKNIEEYEKIMMEDEERYNKLRLWGHSHHSMGVTPSGTDEAQLAKWVDRFKNETVNPYFFMLILNNKGDVRVDLYDVASNLVYESIDAVTLVAKNKELHEQLDKIIAEKVRVKTYVAPKQQNTPVSFFDRHRGYTGNFWFDDDEEYYNYGYTGNSLVSPSVPKDSDKSRRITGAAHYIQMLLADMGKDINKTLKSFSPSRGHSFWFTLANTSLDNNYGKVPNKAYKDHLKLFAYIGDLLSMLPNGELQDIFINYMSTVTTPKSVEEYEKYFDAKSTMYTKIITDLSDEIYDFIATNSPNYATLEVLNTEGRGDGYSQNQFEEMQQILQMVSTITACYYLFNGAKSVSFVLDLPINRMMKPLVTNIAEVLRMYNIYATPTSIADASEGFTKPTPISTTKARAKFFDDLYEELQEYFVGHTEEEEEEEAQNKENEEATA